MKILLLSEDKSIFEENSAKLKKLLNYSSFINELFIFVLTQKEEDESKSKQINKSTWLYRATSQNKYLRILKAFRMASFELTSNRIFHADLIICEDQFISTFTGYLLAKKFKRPLYIFLTEENEKQLFYPKGFKNSMLSKILWFILHKSDFIKVDTERAKNIILKRSQNYKVELIKPFVDFKSLAINTKSENEITARNLLKSKFPQERFTSVVYINNVEQAKIALNILLGLNSHFPPTSLLMIISDNLDLARIKRLIKKIWEPYVCVETLNDDLAKYISKSNVFLGISTGEIYEEILNKACAVGARIIALKSELSTKLIEDEVTGYLCPTSKEKEVVEYFVKKTFYLMNNPLVGLNFKVNLPSSFKQQFNETEEGYNNKLKVSLEVCLEKYKKDHKKYYEY